MADARVQLRVEGWVREEWLPGQFGQGFRADRVKLTSGGFFDFDAVSDNDTIAANISTSRAMTPSGKRGSRKLMKTRSDMFFLLLAPVERRIVVLTESDMFDHWQKETEGGRVPPQIEFLHARGIPDELVARLKVAKKSAADEVSPHKESESGAA